MNRAESTIRHGHDDQAVAVVNRAAAELPLAHTRPQGAARVNRVGREASDWLTLTTRWFA